jgi:hypothetical protein
MVKRKLLALLLLILGTLWALTFAWFHLVMSGIAETVLPLPIHLFVGFVGPALLIVGSILAIAAWHARFGAICCIVVCALLTYFLGGDILETYLQPVRHPNNAIQSPYTLGTSIAVTVEATFFIVADVAAIALLRSIKSSNQSLEPTAGPRDAHI